MERLALKMEDGCIQYVDTSVADLAPGDRVESTTESF
jgi:hypothetical protein